jgi:hypothetical protein
MESAMRHVRTCALLVLLCGAAASGCRNLARPPWLAPGPSDYQRSNAVVHDPYPDTQHGPEALGTRPRDYDNPPSDSQRYPLFRGGSAPAGATW